jgi:hypothetical protein
MTAILVGVFQGQRIAGNCKIAAADNVNIIHGAVDFAGTVEEGQVEFAQSIGTHQRLRGFPFHSSKVSILLLALYFSLLSATRIGWHELNVGTWLTRIESLEYSLRATGWVRVVSGTQSLISVYLVALAILAYFGSPFEY